MEVIIEEWISMHNILMRMNRKKTPTKKTKKHKGDPYESDVHKITYNSYIVKGLCNTASFHNSI